MMCRRDIVPIDLVSKERHYSIMDDWRFYRFIHKMHEFGRKVT